ncbi:MAG: hypothetical protein HLX51_01680 [Micrococcaceae bacterium]|nr:hypothetical protein [Micrococcaceae bacterium]
MKPTKFITTLAITMFALTACNNGQQPANTETAEDAAPETQEVKSLEHGTYQAQPSNGATVTLELPATDDEVLASIEQYRDTVQATEPVTYVTVDLDNREGTGDLSIDLSVFDGAGNQYEFHSLDQYTDEIRPSTDYAADEPVTVLADGTEMPAREGTRLTNETSDLLEEYTGYASQGARETTVHVYQGDNLPDQFTRVAITERTDTGSGQQIEAHPTQK